MTADLIVYVLFWVLMGVLSAVIAGQKGRSPIVWLIAGTLTSIIGLIIIVLLPPANRIPATHSVDAGAESPKLDRHYPAEDDNPMDGKFGEYLPLAIAAIAVGFAVIYALSS